VLSESRRKKGEFCLKVGQDACVDFITDV
jgi:hypothetical protein